MAPTTPRDSEAEPPQPQPQSHSHASTLTIRNLTPYHLSVSAAAVLPASISRRHGILATLAGHVSSALTSIPFRSSCPVAVATDDGSSALSSHDDPGVDVPPFRSLQTRIPAPCVQGSGCSVARLDVCFRSGDGDGDGDSDGEEWRYRVDVPCRDNKMENLSGSPHEFEAVYVEGQSTLAVLTSTDPSSWMSNLRSDLPLSSLSIPGTHNSPTSHWALPSVRCQAVALTTQLENGVRFLDVRVSARRDSDRWPDAFQLVHGAFPVGLLRWGYLEGFLDEVYAFLERRGGETVVLSLKREGVGKGSDEDMARRLEEVYCKKRPEMWYVGTRIPTLGEARGKIVLVRRFNLHESQRKHGWGADAQGWPDNAEDGKAGGGHMRVQDFYEVTAVAHIDKKMRFSLAQLERAAAQTTSLPGMRGYKAGDEKKPPPMFINFLTGSNFFNPSCWPERVAAKLNPAVVEYLCTRHGEDGKGPNELKVGDGGTGVVVMDWIGAGPGGGDWEIVRCVVGMNARLMLKG